MPSCTTVVDLLINVLRESCGAQRHQLSEVVHIHALPDFLLLDIHSLTLVRSLMTCEARGSVKELMVLLKGIDYPPQIYFLRL